MVFSGPPEALEAVVDINPSARRAIEVVFDDGLRCRALGAPAGPDTTLVRLLLDQTTPPGDYRARVVAGERELSALVRVDAQPELSMQPDALVFHPDRDGVAEAEVLIHNLGNTVFTPRVGYAVGILESGALDAAVGQALRAPAHSAGPSRLSVVGDVLAERHHSVRVRVRLRDAVSIEAGSSGVGQVELRVGDDVRLRGRHHGVWVLDGLRVPISIEWPGRGQADPA